MKRFLLTPGLISVGVLAFVVIAWPLFHIKNYLLPGSMAIVFNRPYPSDTLNYAANLSEKIIEKNIKSSVVIQSFSEGKLLKQNAGLIVTKDGLIIASNSLLPYSGDFYQIFIEDKPYRAEIKQRSIDTNLVILSVVGDDFEPADFSTRVLDETSRIFILTKSVSLNKVAVTATDLSLGNSSSDNLRLTLASNPAMYDGSVIIDQDGDVWGLLDSRNTQFPITTLESIKKVLKNSNLLILDAT